ncbi:MAG TPA: hypothetical protein GXX17_08100 [Clostridiales bacterium]|nr:hypothetical protein [Clostridiales bacterium]
MFLAIGFVMMVSGFHAESDREHKVTANTALVFSGVYAVLILLIYFAQITAVRLDMLSEEALKILDYKRFGLFFSYDLLGYGVMSLAAFFIGLAIKAESRLDKWLKGLLIAHGAFFISCIITPILGVFNSEMDSAYWIGMLILEFWCCYFLPICILSYLHFAKIGKKQ